MVGRASPVRPARTSCLAPAPVNGRRRAVRAPVAMLVNIAQRATVGLQESVSRAQAGNSRIAHRPGIWRAIYAPHAAQGNTGEIAVAYRKAPANFALLAVLNRMLVPGMRSAHRARRVTLATCASVAILLRAMVVAFVGLLRLENLKLAEASGIQRRRNAALALQASIGKVAAVLLQVFA